MSHPSGNNCLSCTARQKKCDQSRPTCRRCIRAGIECEGYAPSKTSAHKPAEPKSGIERNPSQTSPSSLRTGPSAIQIIDLTPMTADSVPMPGPQTFNSNPPYQLITPISPGTRTSAAISGDHAPYVPTNTTRIPFSPDWSDETDPSLADFSNETSPSTTLETPSIGKSQDFSPPRSAARQAPTPPYEVADIPSSDVIPQLPALSHTRAKKTMTPGQASLFDALFSLGQPETETRRPDPVPHPLRNATPGQASLFDALFSLGHPTQPELNSSGTSEPIHSVQDSSQVLLPSAMPNMGIANISPVEDKGLADSRDTENVHGIIFNTLKLDRRIQSNSIPFVLQSYALWMTRFLFEPVRVIPLAREYVVGGYGLGPEARWRMMLAAYVVRTVTTNTAYDLGSPPNLAILQGHMCRGFETVKCRRVPDREQDRQNAMRSLDSVYELVSMLFKITPLSTVLNTMQSAAPIFRRACPDPPEELVHLPSLLANINVSLQFYATLDVLLSTLTNRPMFFRYNVTFTAQITEAIFNLEEGPGFRWLYGVPDRLVITLARMNALLEDYGSYVDPEIVKELEVEIGSFKSAVSPSVDPSLTVGRLVVQECWRQAAFIYLYMGLCGADSQDARVIKAHGRFMKLLKGAKPARNPDSFLVKPIVIFGMATHSLADQDVIRKRMLNLPECARPNTVGNDALRILDDVWSRTSAIGRLAVWPDLRLACLRITGM